MNLKDAYTKDNNAFLIFLQHRTTSRKYVVANVHLYWNPKYQWVKLRQAAYLGNLFYLFFPQIWFGATMISWNSIFFEKEKERRFLAL